MSKGMIAIIIALAILGLVVELQGIHYRTITNGTHTGFVTAVETTGILFKTTRVYVKTDAQSSQEDVYCLIDKSLIPILKELESSKQQITIKYDNYFIQGWRYCDAEPAGIIIGVK